MPTLVWDQDSDRKYETGVQKGVLYPGKGDGYDTGVAWNGLTTITESPSGAESNPQYADNIKYLDLMSTEEFGATIEAFTYPDEFGKCDGSAELSPGVVIGQQSRIRFALCYRTVLGDSIDNNDHAYKLHIIYGCKAAPSEKAYATVNDSPEPITFSWEVTTTPTSVTGHKPTSTMILNSEKIPASDMKAIEDILYGTSTLPPRVPLPDEIISILSSGAPAPAAPSGTGE